MYKCFRLMTFLLTSSSLFQTANANTYETSLQFVQTSLFSKPQGLLGASWKTNISEQVHWGVSTHSALGQLRYENAGQRANYYDVCADAELRLSQALQVTPIVGLSGGIGRFGYRRTDTRIYRSTSLHVMRAYLKMAKAFTEHIRFDAGAAYRQTAMTPSSEMPTAKAFSAMEYTVALTTIL